MPDDPVVVLPDLRRRGTGALIAAETLAGQARQSVAALVGRNGRADAALLEREQFAAHGLAWMNTYVAALRQLADWAERLEADGTFGELDGLILQAGFGEYLQQLRYRSEEHTSELQSLMRTSYAVFCLKKKTKLKHKPNTRPITT